jgi:tetratricopeptide (TPR) repeat protein
MVAEARLLRADLLCGWGARLKDEALLRAALDDAATAADRLDLAYEPLTWARAEILRGQALALWGEACGDIDAVAAGASTLAGALDHLTRDHSPLDWARTHMALAQALQALGEASADERAYEQAVTCYDRANLVLRDAPATPLRGLAAGARAICLARSAELTGDLGVLDTAEAALKIELAALQPRRDPVAWALAQMHLARLYEARVDITGKDRGERAAGVLALDAALDVFGEQGLRTLSVMASDALERLRAGPAPKRTAV